MNRRHGLVGHFFQGRFKAILVERDAYLLELSRYVVLNPVRAGVVAEVSDWPWSSYRAMVGKAPVPGWLETDSILGQFGQVRAQAQAGCAAFVDAGAGQPSVWAGLRHQAFLGSEGFVERICAASQPLARLRQVPRAQRRPLTKPLVALATAYPERREAMARAFLTGVYTMQEIADHFGVHYSTVSRAVSWLEAGRRSASKHSAVAPDA
jgi:putative transposase